MIPFGSQRGLGQDLAIHLSNAQDNERVEFADLRGAIAPDLNGAFAEWEAQAYGLTNCKNYLYSLSVNPDPKQEPLTREQYFEYIERVEERLGLIGQPRAVVFHVKNGRHHAHVVWSRIDSENERAVHLPFDHEKVMMVAREFARDHGIELPAGYFKEKGADKTHQITLYEQEQQRATGISQEDRKEQITSAWRESDSPRAFVQALADRGYMLATGRRPYVLVDLYGHSNALPKLIDDKSVRLKHVRAFLEKEFPPDSLPSVEEAEQLVAEHRKYLDAFLENEQRETALSELENNWSDRRTELDNKQRSIAQKQQQERQELAFSQRDERRALTRAYAALNKAVQAQRVGAKATGLAAFLGRVSGVELIRKKIYSYQDKRRRKAHTRKLLALREEQKKQRRAQQQRHKLQRLDLQRQVLALGQIEERERSSLIKDLKAQARVNARGGSAQIPGLPFVVKGVARELSDHEKHELSHATEREFDEAAAGRVTETEIDLSAEFTRAAEGEKEEEGRGESEAQNAKVKVRPARRRRPRKRRDKDQDLDRDR